jgi:hypothetical protein
VEVVVAVVDVLKLNLEVLVESVPVFDVVTAEVLAAVFCEPKLNFEPAPDDDDDDDDAIIDPNVFLADDPPNVEGTCEVVGPLPEPTDSVDAVSCCPSFVACGAGDSHD